MATKDNMDWLKKPDHLKNDRPKTQRKKTQNKKYTTETPLQRFIKHCCIILAVAFILAASSHFLLRLGTRHGVTRVVPEFASISLNEAKILAAENDLNIIVNDSVYAPAYQAGAVLEQLPRAGIIVKPGRSVYVTINRTQKMTVKLPYVSGRSLRQAISMIRAASLEVEKLEYTPDLAGDYVLAQYYNGEHIVADGDIRVPIGSGVVLQVGLSSEQEPCTTPQLLNLPLTEAKRLLWESGLNVGTVRYDEKIEIADLWRAKVYLQSIEGDVEAKYGETVSLSLTLDEKKSASLLAEARRSSQREQREKMIIDSVSRVAAEQNVLVEELLEQMSFEQDELRF